MKGNPKSDAPSPRLVKPSERKPLGDMLQRLAAISPTDVYAITALVRDVLRAAERTHRRYRRYIPPHLKK